MTAIPFNETRTCIEDARASAGYAEKMISLADQYRREGNHAAANAALMLTWNIRANIAKITDFGRTAPHPFGGFGVNRRPFGRFRLRTRRTPRFAIFSLCERTPDPHELCGSISAPTGEHLCMPGRIGQPNQPNLRVAPLGTISDEIFANLDGAPLYGSMLSQAQALRWL